MKNEIVYGGVDVSKAHLDVALGEKRWRRANDKKAISQLVRELKRSSPNAHIICEASGGYEQPLLRALHKAQIAVTLVQANRVRQFARAAGVLAKTDRIDAEVLARFGAAIRPAATAPEPEQLLRLRQLDRQRDHWTRLLVAEKSRLAQLEDKELIRLARTLIKQIELRIKTLEQRIKSLIARDEALQTRAQKLTQVKGVGQRTAIMLLAQMPQLGQLKRAQVAALAGVAPLNRDSGSMRGKRFIYGGRRDLRRRLYMAALCAARTNHILSPVYQRLIAAGKPPKLALIAVMRKLLIALNSRLSPKHA